MAASVPMPDWLQGERRRPTAPSMLGAIGGLLVLGGVLELFEELPAEHERVTGLALALLTLLVGCLLAFVDRDGPGRAAGVALAAGAVLPLTGLIVDRPEQFDKADALVAGLLASLVWAALFVVGPARGHGLLLGLVLAGLWLTALSQTDPGSVIGFFGAAERGESVEVGTRVELEPFESEVVELPTPTFTPPELTRPDFTVPTMPPPELIFPEPRTVPFPTPTFRFEAPSTTNTTTTTSTTTTTTTPEESLGGPDLVVSTQDEDEDSDRSPVAPGVVSLLFGSVYLAGGAVLDAVRLRRIASTVIVVGAVALVVAAVSFGFRYGIGITGLLGLVFGAAFVAVGLTGSRRFLAWFGAAVTAGGIGTIVADRIDDSPATMAVLLLVVGAAIVCGGMALRLQER